MIQREENRYVMLSWQAGGFTAQMVLEYRTSLGSEIYKRVEQRLEPIQGFRHATNEARRWAEYNNVPFRHWE
jgi:hypothetical protein